MRVALLWLLVASVGAAAPKHEPAAVVLLLDHSGSMKGPKLDAVKAAALEALAPADRITVVFDEATAVIPALERADRVLKDFKVARKHIILFTDGGSSADGLDKVLDRLHEHHVTISTVGVQGADRNLLQRISEAGEGRLYMVDDAKSIPKIFVKEIKDALGR